MTDMGKDHFNKNWEQSKQEHQEMDMLTDQRIRKGIIQKMKFRKNIKRFYWSAAAAIIVGLGLSVFFNSQNSEIKPEMIYQYSSTNVHKKIQLPDGSNITLEPYSSVVLSKTFGQEDRIISFRGKGVFDIAKDAKKPFVIGAADFKVIVLGTKFFLDQTTGKGKVDLYEGKVKIEHEGEITFLLPNESWTEYKEVEIKEFDKNLANSKRDFVFADESFENIIQQLENTYQLEIIYPQEYSERKIQGSFSGSLEEVLSAISYPFNLKPEKISNNKIQLK